MTYWTNEDEGLLRAYKTRNYLRTHDELQNIPYSSPVMLQPGERYFATSQARVQEARTYTTLPDNWSYFKLRTRVAADPLMAPFIFILLLPFNLVSRFISYQRAKKVETRWATIANGPMVVTDQALVQASTPGQFRMTWLEMSAVDLCTLPLGINITWRNRSYLLEVPAEDRLNLFVMLRYMAIGDRGNTINVPEEFLAHARSLGKL